ncbi:hypothetical protein GUJ93_ZPchr0005g14366 [Zizania palustris]|uniref:Uncharacterized protein n=1 Tax=Zizania palustris TaxID=103762 RepID=A0A8J5SQF5_ZIZPA|nr:hypothetical protein GUJ93_ZPchr0005g14366 [Zizania palustris]
MAVGYSNHIVARLSSLVSFCSHRLSRASRRLLRHHRCYGGGADKRRTSAASEPVIDKGEALWRRTILMGERCQPLDFAGAVHDSFGRRLARPTPNPRSASSLSCCSSDSLASSEASYKQNLGDLMSSSINL